jgi:hypothetical protein
MVLKVQGAASRLGTDDSHTSGALTAPCFRVASLQLHILAYE